ncbi:protein MHF1 homolog isoform X3 [Vitis riparia]|uniref:protein MHF1 homolog isoform X2 n=1 Tax=Vitis vinifera TaxID=29760 RepID=UPI0008FEB1BF|nr:protein MHF1 homolog isoform X2 [Vitis vinifera]XP_034672768.1 protein MHF1 homolog isoform X3 [Vitis riparia]|eukprot:XP_019082012.1 PREDICTED: uncharacterized protein LOC100257797 isoform X2 [Vitis vinifera]
MEEARSELEREEDEEATELLRDRFRLSTISIVEAQAKKSDMEISEPIVACISDLAFKYTAHRNKHLASSLRSFCNDLKAKEIPSERKRKKASRKEDKASTSVVHIPDL